MTVGILGYCYYLGTYDILLYSTGVRSQLYITSSVTRRLEVVITVHKATQLAILT